MDPSILLRISKVRFLRLNLISFVFDERHLRERAPEKFEM